MKKIYVLAVRHFTKTPELYIRQLRVFQEKRKQFVKDSDGTRYELKSDKGHYFINNSAHTRAYTKEDDALYVMLKANTKKRISNIPMSEKLKEDINHGDFS